MKKVLIIGIIVVILILLFYFRNESHLEKAKRMVEELKSYKNIDEILDDDLEKTIHTVYIIGIPSRENFNGAEKPSDFGWFVPPYSNYAFPNAYLWPGSNYPSALYTAMRQFTPGFQTNGLTWFLRPNLHRIHSRGRWAINNGHYYYIY